MADNDSIDHYLAARRVLRRVVAAGAHPRYEALEAVVDGRASVPERAALDSHLAWCPRCAAELADLQGQAPVLRERVALGTASATTAASATSAFGSRWRALLTAWAPLALSCALAGVAVLVGVEQSRRSPQEPQGSESRALPGAETPSPSPRGEHAPVARPAPAPAAPASAGASASPAPPAAARPARDPGLKPAR